MQQENVSGPSLGACDKEGHKKLRLQYLCLQDGCKGDRRLCSMCIHTKHKNHKLTQLNGNSHTDTGVSVDLTTRLSSNANLPKAQQYHSQIAHHHNNISKTFDEGITDMKDYLETSFNKHFDPQFSAILGSFESDTRKKMLTALSPQQKGQMDAIKSNQDSEVQNYVRMILLAEKVDLSQVEQILQLSRKQQKSFKGIFDKYFQKSKIVFDEMMEELKKNDIINFQQQGAKSSAKGQPKTEQEDNLDPKKQSGNQEKIDFSLKEKSESQQKSSARPEKQSEPQQVSSVPPQSQNWQMSSVLPEKQSESKQESSVLPQSETQQSNQKISKNESSNQKESEIPFNEALLNKKVETQQQRGDSSNNQSQKQQRINVPSNEKTTIQNESSQPNENNSEKQEQQSNVPAQQQQYSSLSAQQQQSSVLAQQQSSVSAQKQSQKEESKDVSSQEKSETQVQERSDSANNNSESHKKQKISFAQEVLHPQQPDHNATSQRRTNPQ